MSGTPNPVTGCHLCVVDNIKGDESVLQALETTILVLALLCSHL